MKSYFSRLIARAQLPAAPVQAELRTRPVADPFENAAIEPLAPPQTAAQPAMPSPRSTGQQPGAPRVTTEISRPVPRATPLVPEREVSLPVRSEPHREQERTPEVTKPAERREETRQIERITPAVPEQMPATARVEQEAVDGEASRQEADETAERVARVEHDQQLLQRKADDFMSRLLQSRTRDDEETAAEPLSEPTAALLPRREPPGVEPAETPRARAEREPELPSVVIGNLTVEVVRPAPTPPPREQIVVVPAPRGGGSEVPSTHRFGLGQF